MEAGLLLGLTCLCSPLAALVLDFNTIRGSAEVSTSGKSTQCLTDKDCPVGRFCHKTREELPSCAACHGLRRRCQRSTMCCPGMLCINDVCSQAERMMLAGGRKKPNDRTRVGSKDTIQPPLPSGRVLKEGNPQTPPGKAQEGESCLRTADCVRGLCCARHFWTKVCKPVLMEGQICSRRGGQKEGAQGPEIFQRCNCGPGLSCQLPLGGAPQRSRLRVCLRK
ncbi:dickkopf-related protein 4 [Sceloporus undulatus]|uniref:dickkopf-related protein 4 n=1 Tax=Sceloporus undulatus TaxID=8520 RepID=UPI001C4AF175|nr:dickkopf-related protein 4 [Sceloporus undulatus]